MEAVVKYDSRDVEILVHIPGTARARPQRNLLAATCTCGTNIIAGYQAAAGAWGTSSAA